MRDSNPRLAGGLDRNRYDLVLKARHATWLRQ
jgi:hypothetical protein